MYPDEPFGSPMNLAPWNIAEFDGPASLRPCLECGAMVPDDPEALACHLEFHARLRAVRGEG